MDELKPYPERQATSNQDILQHFTDGSVMLVYNFSSPWPDYRQLALVFFSGGQVLTLVVLSPLMNELTP